MIRIPAMALASVAIALTLATCNSASADPADALRISAPFALTQLTEAEAQNTSLLLQPFAGHTESPPTIGARHVTQDGANVGFVAYYRPSKPDPEFFQKAGPVLAGDRVATQSTILGRAVFVTQGDQRSVYYQLGDGVVDVVGNGSTLPEAIALALIAATRE